MAEIEKVLDGLYRLRSNLKFMCAGIHRDYYNNYMIYVNNAIQTIQEFQSKSEEACEWTLFDEETNAYNTTCGGAFWLNDGSPKDNGFKYCPYCGRKIKVVE